MKVEYHPTGAKYTFHDGEVLTVSMFDIRFLEAVRYLSPTNRIDLMRLTLDDIKKYQDTLYEHYRKDLLVKVKREYIWNETGEPCNLNDVSVFYKYGYTSEWVLKNLKAKRQAFPLKQIEELYEFFQYNKEIKSITDDN